QQLQNQYHCSGTDTFVKVVGNSPSRGELIPLYSGLDTNVTRECLQRCRNSSDCIGFLVDYSSSICYRVSSSSSSTTTSNDMYGYHYSNNTQVRYFERICINTELGYLKEFHNLNYCAFKKTRFACRSAEFVYSARRCSLSNQDRHIVPDSYRATPYNIDYLENQCVDPVPHGQTCAFEESPNRTLIYRDIEFPGLSQNQCHDRCVNETNFICRSFTYVPASFSASGISACWLNSEDTLSSGPRALTFYQGAVYMERAPCINLMVICSENYINVTLRTVEPFRGRLYVNGYTQVCDVEGKGDLVTTLLLPMKDNGPSSNCGITVIKSIGVTNKTLLSTVIVIQQNPIILRRGDRAVKIGCLLDTNISDGSNGTVNASIIVTGPDNLTGGGTVVYNTTTGPPTVRIRIVDHNTGNSNTREVELGQELEFRIDVDPDNGPFDIMAGHLVATSADGSYSVLLLNDRGCPPDPTTFPAFRKVNPNSRSLVANFRAFKFQGSPVVRFTVMVQFCPGKCPSIDCGVEEREYGRIKRHFETNATLYEEMPLQTAIVVRSPQLAPSSLISADNTNGKIIIAGIDDAPGSVCVYYGAIIGLVIAWLLLQFLILIACYFVVRERYKRRVAEDNMQHKLQDDFSGFDNNRHVHWADERNSTWYVTFCNLH
ncbi:hypothetical protein L9F63_000188, partial [Diploptera punctata]